MKCVIIFGTKVHAHKNTCTHTQSVEKQNHKSCDRIAYSDCCESFFSDEMSDNNTVHGIVSQLKRLPSTSGIVNFTSIGMILPVVKSFVILNFLLLSFEIVKHILCIKIYESQEKQTKLRILEINSQFSYNSYLTCRNYL